MLGLIDRRAARHVYDLGLLGLLLVVVGVLGMVVVAVVGRAILGDQAGALDAPILFFVDNPGDR